MSVVAGFAVECFVAHNGAQRTRTCDNNCAHRRYGIVAVQIFQEIVQIRLLQDIEVGKIDEHFVFIL